VSLAWVVRDAAEEYVTSEAKRPASSPFLRPKGFGGGVGQEFVVGGSHPCRCRKTSAGVPKSRSAVSLAAGLEASDEVSKNLLAERSERSPSQRLCGPFSAFQKLQGSVHPVRKPRGFRTPPFPKIDLSENPECF